jgi:hypothetical protein
MTTLKRLPRSKTPLVVNEEVDQILPEDAPPVRLATVPDAIYAASYVSRKIGKLSDLELLDYALQKGNNVLIYGPTGPGKTSLVLAHSAARGRPFYSVPSNIALDPSQLFGKLAPDGTGGYAWYDGGVTDIVRYGGTLLINEVNFMPERIATTIFELLDRRREIRLLDHKGEVVRAHRPQCWCDLSSAACKERWVLIVADMNPGYEGTRPLNKAFRNRFKLQVPWDYDPEVEKKLVQSSTLLTIAANTRRLVGNKIETPIATNMLIEFEEMVVDLGLDFAVMSFVNRFDADERQAVQGAFDALRDQLDDDYAPDDSVYDEYLDGHDEWIDSTARVVVTRDEEDDDDDDSDPEWEES